MTDSNAKGGLDRRSLLAAAAAVTAAAPIQTASAQRRPQQSAAAACSPRVHAPSTGGAPPALRRRADALLAQMSPQEKAGQLSIKFKFTPGPNPELEAAIASGALGNVLFVSDAREINALQRVAIETSRLRIPLLFGLDVVHGLRTIFPVPIGMAASWDPAMVENAQSIAAAESRAAGLHWTFAPMVDVSRDPRWGRIVEGAGEDPFLGAAMAAAQVRGFQGEVIGAPDRIIAGPKHFAAYGAAMGGRDYDEVSVPENDLWNIYFPPFAAAIAAGAGNIMTAYMPLNGIPATGNRWLLNDVLRGAWGFDGFVVSDNNAVHDLVAHGFAKDDQDAATRALNAGVDMEMGHDAYATLPTALAAGQITQTMLDDAVRNVLLMKLRMGLFETPYVDEGRAHSVWSAPDSRVAARQAAERCAVLLRNQQSVLPLDPSRVRSIAVIGPLADNKRSTLGPWVFAQDESETVTVLEGLRTKLGDDARITYAMGAEMPARRYPSPFVFLNGPRITVTNYNAAAERERAVAAARDADVAILVLGEGQEMVGEVASRASSELPGDQQALLEAVAAVGKPVILLLMCARPLNLSWASQNVAAIMNIWYPGSQGGAAVANLLFGDASPGGKLPISWLRTSDHAPNPYNQLNSMAPQTRATRYWDGNSTPLYPFGFGLSYSTFAIENLRLDRATARVGETIVASVEVRNTGTRRADETVQLYIHQRYGSAARPRRELKAFQRVKLSPGETRTTTFELGPDQLRYWCSATRDWIIDAAVFEVYAGADSSARLTTTFELT